MKEYGFPFEHTIHPISVIGRTALHHFPVHDGKDRYEQEHSPADGAISEIVIHEGFTVQVEDDGHTAAADAAIIANKHLRFGEDLHAADGRGNDREENDGPKIGNGDFEKD